MQGAGQLWAPEQGTKSIFTCHPQTCGMGSHPWKVVQAVVHVIWGYCQLISGQISISIDGCS
jgi:hypothetical protein